MGHGRTLNVRVLSCHSPKLGIHMYCGKGRVTLSFSLSSPPPPLSLTHFLYLILPTDGSLQFVETNWMIVSSPRILYITYMRDINKDTTVTITLAFIKLKMKQIGSEGGK